MGDYMDWGIGRREYVVKRINQQSTLRLVNYHIILLISNIRLFVTNDTYLVYTSIFAIILKTVLYFISGTK